MSGRTCPRIGRLGNLSCQSKFLRISGVSGPLRRAHSLRKLGLSCFDQVKTPLFFLFFRLSARLWVRYALKTETFSPRMNEGVATTPYFPAHITHKKCG